MSAPPSFNDRIYRLVARIPRGKVATYGQLARLIGAPTRARQVGYAMAALKGGTTLPWHRVINSKGEVSRRKVYGAELTQRMLLVKEGMRFNPRGRLDLDQYQWQPRAVARKKR